MNLQAPKARNGGHVPSFLESRKRSEEAAAQLVQEACIKGVSTRKTGAVVKALGIEGISGCRRAS